ncbi:MAG: MFS family permease [Bacillariaceae sp.]|jgi:MFS family permease
MMSSSFRLIRLLIVLHVAIILCVDWKNNNQYGPSSSGGGVVVSAFTTSNLFSKRRRTEESSSFPFTITYAKDPKSTRNQQEIQYDTTSTNSVSTTTTSAIAAAATPESSPQEGVMGPFTLLIASQFLLFIGVGAVIPSIPLYGKEIGLSGAALGLVISAPAVALFLMANWSGRRADIARKPAMMIGMAVIAVSDVGTALAVGLPSLIIARLGLGAGRALSEAGERGMLVDLTNQIPSMRGRALAFQQAAIGLGIAIGAPIGGIVVERYGPRAAFYCVSVAATIALVLYAFLPETIVRRDDNKNKEENTTTTAATTEEILNENTSGIKVWIELLKEKQWRGLTLCQSGASMGYAAKIASIPILAADTLPGGAAGAGFLLSACGLSGLIGAPIGGALTDKIGAKGTAILGGIVCSIGLVLIPFALTTTADATQTINLSTAAAATTNNVPVELVIGGVLLQSKALYFSSAVLLWSFGVSAQGPALTALAQEKCSVGVEATSLSLVKASGDGTYIVAPFLLGLVTDALTELPGIECALAGSATFLGTMALAILVQDKTDLKAKKVMFQNGKKE